MTSKDVLSFSYETINLSNSKNYFPFAIRLSPYFADGLPNSSNKCIT